MSGYYDRSPLTPDDIERQGFAIAHRGYEREQVRTFLYEAAAALRLALQGGGAGMFGPPPQWSAGRVDEHGYPRDQGFDANRLIRAHLSASLRQEVEHDQDAEAILEQARLDAAELLSRAETEAEQQRDRARRVLMAAQEEATALVAEAEARARRVLSGARQDALNHAQQVSATLESRTEQLVDAERSTLQRLNEGRRQLSKLIEELAGAEPVVGPTFEILHLAVDARMNQEAATYRVGETDPAGEDETSGGDEHPVARMVRSAVSRAMDAAAGADRDPDPVVAEPAMATAAATPTESAASSSSNQPEGTAPSPPSAPPGPAAPTPAETRAARTGGGRSAGGRAARSARPGTSTGRDGPNRPAGAAEREPARPRTNDLSALLSEIAEIVGDDELNNPINPNPQNRGGDSGHTHY